jgi:hypothetical protein
MDVFSKEICPLSMFKEQFSTRINFMFAPAPHLLPCVSGGYRRQIRPLLPLPLPPPHTHMMPECRCFRPATYQEEYPR